MSWNDILLKQYQDGDLEMIAIPTTTNRLMGQIQDKTLPRKLTRKKIREAMNRIIDTEDWPIDDEHRDAIVTRAQEVLEVLDETKKIPKNKVDSKTLSDMVEEYLQGHHENLEDYLNKKRRQSINNKKTLLTFLNASDTDDIPFDRLKDYVKDNEELYSTAVGKLVGLEPKYDEDATIEEGDINDERVKRYVDFVITTKMDDVSRNKLLPETSKGEKFNSILGGKRIIRYPALEYILNNATFDLEASDFKAESPSRLQEKLVINDLAQGANNTETIGLQSKFNEWVSRQSTKKPETRDKTGNPFGRIGRLRGTDNFRQHLEGEYLTEYNKRMKSKKIAGMTGLTIEDWDALAAFDRGEVVDNLNSMAGGLLPIGKLYNKRKLRKFFQDPARKEAFYNMKETGGMRRLTDLNARGLLSDLFYQEGTAETTMSHSYKTSKPDITHRLNDGVFDVNQLTPQDVIELLRAIEFAYVRRSKMNSAFNAFKKEPNLKLAIKNLLTTTVANYETIRRKFFTAISQKIVEETKNPNGIVRRWVIKERGQ